MPLPTLRTASASRIRWRWIAQEAAGQLRYEIRGRLQPGVAKHPMAGATVRVISGNFHRTAGGHCGWGGFPAPGLVRKVDVAGIQRTLDMGALVLLSPFGFSPRARRST